MKQLGLGFNLFTKNTRKREFPEEMEHVVPWGTPARSSRCSRCPIVDGTKQLMKMRE